jgi:hypothetical protein
MGYLGEGGDEHWPGSVNTAVIDVKGKISVVEGEAFVK